MTAVPAQVLLATWNGERWLEEQVRSILGQDHADLRLLVRDDGSTDSTVRILRSFADADDRVLLLPDDGERLGPAGSFSRLLAAAPPGAPAYLFADQDDVWLPHKVGRAVADLAGRTGPTLHACRTRFCDATLASGTDAPRPRRPLLGNALVQNLFPGCSTAIDDAARSLVLRWPLPEEIHLDYWVYILVAAFGTVSCDREIGILHRMHGSNATLKPRPLHRTIPRRLARILQDGAGHPFALHAAALLTGPDPLSTDARELVEWFVHERPTVRSRVGLTLSRRVWREPLVEDLALRLRLLLVGP